MVDSPQPSGPRDGARRRRSDKLSGLAVTALYTAEVWRREGFTGADLLSSPEATRVFWVTQAALKFAGLGRALRWKRRGPQSPLPIALAHRHALIDGWAAESDADVVLELAAGLSPRGYWLSGQSRRPVVEVDTPEVISAKRRLLKRSFEGRVALARPHWRFVEGDLRTLDFEPLVPPAQTAMVIAEGLLMYLDAEAQRAFFRRIASVLASGGGTFVADLVPPAEEPRPGPAGRILGWLMQRATRGHGFATGPRTRADVLTDLATAGFQHVEAVEPHAVAATLSLPHPDVWTRQVVFRAELAARERSG